MNHSNPLPERLRALPAYTPPAGGLAELNRRLHARRRNFAVAGGGFALAASVLVAVGLVGMRPDTVAPIGAPVQTQVASTPVRQVSPAVAQLISRSQALERQLAYVRPQVAVWNTGRDTRAMFLETELRRVDQELNFAEAADAEALWSRRVQLMHALVDLHDNEAPALQYASYQY
jgi:capsule polysaccharide export protein KpsE/RkpR